MIRINQIKMPISYSEEDLIKKIQKILRTREISEVKLVKKSLDARDKSFLVFILCVDVKCRDEKSILSKNINNNNIMLTKEEKYIFPEKQNGKCNISPIVIGAGPAGYFCALYLARNGFKPIVFERGKNVTDRTMDVDKFWSDGEINPDSNVSFGEGGAGTFSDGKLNTGIKDKSGRIKAVIDDFVLHGAPESISYLNKPHIGTDNLKNVMKGIREEIEELGGKVCFNSKFVDYVTDGNDIKVSVSQDNTIKTYNTKALVLAIGHSARDTFKMLNERKLYMEAKSFAMGLRIEHKRKMIDVSQYGDSDEALLLPAADYKMTYRSEAGRSVYSFCMCPGGFVVNASSDKMQSVVNGMSNYGRDEENSNSAIVVNVTPDDFLAEGFGEYGVLSGVEFQKKYERLAYEEGNGKIPIQLFKDYKNNVKSDDFESIKPNIKGKYSFGNLNNCLPVYVNNAIIEGICYYDRKLKGFACGDAVLSGIESRTSSPVRITRNDKYMGSQYGIFPCGEGAGYAGGITSASVDGIKVAEAVAVYLNTLGEENE